MGLTDYHDSENHGNQGIKKITVQTIILYILYIHVN